VFGVQQTGRDAEPQPTRGSGLARSSDRDRGPDKARAMAAFSIVRRVLRRRRRATRTGRATAATARRETTAPDDVPAENVREEDEFPTGVLLQSDRTSRQPGDPSDATGSPALAPPGAAALRRRPPTAGQRRQPAGREDTSPCGRGYTGAARRGYTQLAVSGADPRIGAVLIGATAACGTPVSDRSSVRRRAAASAGNRVGWPCPESAQSPDSGGVCSQSRLRARDWAPWPHLARDQVDTRAREPCMTMVC